MPTRISAKSSRSQLSNEVVLSVDMPTVHAFAPGLYENYCTNIWRDTCTCVPLVVPAGPCWGAALAGLCTPAQDPTRPASWCAGLRPTSRAYTQRTSRRVVAGRERAWAGWAGGWGGAVCGLVWCSVGPSFRDRRRGRRVGRVDESALR
jgi:hypothetical protein